LEEHARTQWTEKCKENLNKEPANAMPALELKKKDYEEMKDWWDKEGSSIKGQFSERLRQFMEQEKDISDKRVDISDIPTKYMEWKIKTKEANLEILKPFHLQKYDHEEISIFLKTSPKNVAEYYSNREEDALS